MTFQVGATSVYSNSITYLLASGTLPTGLSVSTTGGISGTVASLVSGTYSFSIAASDTYSNVAQAFSISATARSITWNNATNLGSYVQQTALNLPLIASSSINAALSYTVTGGSLPSGLAIIANAITGTLPSISASTTYNFTITASDGLIANALAVSLTSLTSSTTDAYASNVVLLAHYDNGSMADSLGHPVAACGAPAITSNGVGLYNSSLYLNGTSYLQYSPTLSGYEFQLGSGNFTLEASVYFLANTVGAGIAGVFPNPSNLGYLLYANGLSGFNFAYSTTGANPSVIPFAYTFALNTWYSLAVVRAANSCLGFVNGTYLSTGSLSGTVFGSNFPLVVGASLANGVNLTGFVDELRLTTGVARYGATNYTLVVPFATPPLYNYYLGNSITVIGGGPLSINAVSVYGAQPLTYALTAGTLPAGLTVIANSGVSGLTTNANTTTSATFTLTATDGFSPVSRTFSASVLPGVTPTWVTPAGSLGSQVQGTNFFAQLNAVANALTLTTNTATTVAGNILNFSNTIGVVLGMTILGPNLPSNTVVSAYSATTVTTSQIIPPIPNAITYNFTPTPLTYALATGSLPTGLTLGTATGVISGTLGSVVQNTTTSFSITASTVPALNATQSFSITVQAIAAVDPYASYVTFEAPFNGAAGGKLFYDLAGHTANAVIGNAVISTTKSLIGGSSLYLDGSSGINFASLGNYELTFGNTTSFTIEAAINLTSYGPQVAQIIGVYASAQSWALRVGTSGNGLTYVNSTNGGSPGTYTFSGSTLQLNTWYQIAAVCSNSTMTVYVNGNSVGTSQTIPTNFQTNLMPLTIGTDIQPNPFSNYVYGYIDAVRITKGVARYTANYTPSLVPFQPVFFATPAGSLGTQVQGSNFGVYVIAQSQFEYPVSYFVYSGALPTGLTLDTATGYISGSLPIVVSNTVSTFTIGASDGTGTALQTFSITTATSIVIDPVANAVVAELHFDGLAGTTTFLDAKGHVIQSVNAPPVNNVIRAMGSGSMFLDGVAGFIYIGNAASSYPEFSFGTNDFTVEISVYFPTIPTTACFIEQNQGFGVTFSANKIFFYGTSPGGTTPTGSNYFAWTPSPNTWYQLAFVRSNGVFAAYVNGTALTLTGSATLTTGTYAGYALEIGRYYPQYFWSGYVDEVRVTIGAIGSGAARYTANYVPQTQPFGSPYAPVFITTASSLAIQLQTTPFVVYPLAQEGGAGRTITYAITNGSLPSGLSLNATNGVISGILPAVSTNTTASFTITATDQLGEIGYLPTSISIIQFNQPFFGTNGVVFEAHYTGAPGSTNFTDLKGHVPTVIGAPVISNVQYLNLVSSLYLNGVSYLSYYPSGSEFQFGSNDFTIEFSVYLTVYPSGYTALLNFGNGPSNNALLVYFTGGSLGIYWTTGGSGTGNNPYANFTVTTNTWYRVAVVRAGPNAIFFVNGILQGGTSTFGTNSLYASTGPLTIGNSTLTACSNLTGYITAIRVTIGYSAYVANYAVSLPYFDNPAQPYFVTTGRLFAQTQNSVVDVYLPVSIANGRSIASYAITTGSLTPGLVLNATTGHITGTNPSVTTNTSSTFSVAVTDSTANISYQSFSTTTTLGSQADPYANTVIFLAHFDGPAGSNVVTESVTGTVGTITGGAPVLTSLYRQAGNASLFLNGRTAAASVDFSIGTVNIGTAGFTIECSVLFLSGYPSSTFSFVANGSNPTFGLAYNGTNLGFVYNSGSGISSVPWTPVYGTWYQIAVCQRPGNVYQYGCISFFVNGVELGTTQSFTQTINSSSTPIRVLAPVGMQLCIDEVRISVGVGRYSGTYAPATMAFPDVTGPIIATNYPLSCYSASPATFALPIYLANANTTTISLVSALPSGFSFIGGNSATVVGTAAATNATTSATFVVQAYDSRVPNVAAFGAFVLYNQYDPYAANVVALIHFDGVANGSTSFTETLGHTVVANVVTSAIPTISTTYQYAGTGALYFNAQSPYIQTVNMMPYSGTDFSLGSSNFTIEVAVNFMGFAASGCFTTLVSTSTWAFGIYNNSGTYQLCFANSNSNNIKNNISSLSANVWYCFAVARNGSSLYFYVNGTYIGTQAISGAIATTTAPLTLQESTLFSSSNNSTFGGFMDEIRVTIGVARYTANNYSYVQNLTFPDAIGARLLVPSLAANSTFFANTIAYGYAGNTITASLLVSNVAAMTYTLNTGTLPAGVTLGSANAVVSGTFPVVTNTTIYTFSVIGADGAHFQAYGGNYQIVNLADAYGNAVVMEMHFEGANGSTAFVDTKGHVVSVANGVPTLSNVTAYAGTSSLRLVGNSAIQVTPRVTNDFYLGTAPFPFTLEAAINSSVSTASGTYTIFSQMSAGSQGFWFGIASNYLSLYVYTQQGSSYVSYVASGSFTPGLWYNVAISCLANTSYFFVNGQLLGSTSFTYATVSAHPNPIIVGAQGYGGTYTNFFNGYLDEIRFTKGVGRYIANYATAINVPLPDTTSGVFYQQSPFVGLVASTVSFQIPFVTTDNTVTYSVSSGSLPTGLTLNAANGVITGTLPAVTTNTVALLSNLAVQISGANPLPVIQTYPIYAQNDPYAASVVCELHFEGANGSNSFADSKGHSVTTAYGNPVITNTISYAGNSCLYLNGSSYLQITPTLGNEFFIGLGDVTIELSFYATTLSGLYPHFVSQQVTTGQSQFATAINNNSSGYALMYLDTWTNNGQNITMGLGVTYPPTFQVNTWYSVAWSKVGNTCYGYVNGTYVGNFALTVDTNGGFNNSTSPIYIGGWPGCPTNNFLTGYIDEVRITKLGRYNNNNYTAMPFGSPLPDSTNGLFRLASYYAANSGQSVVAMPTPFYTTSNAVTYALTGGTLPTGLVFNTNGVITGTMPVVSNTTLLSNITVTISDTSPFPVTQTFPIYSLADPYQSNVVVMMHFEGANGSTVFADTISGNSATISAGTPYVSTIAPAQYGLASGYFNGSSGIQLSNSVGYSLGSSNFTIELAMYVSGFGSTWNIIGQDGASPNRGWYIAITSSNQLQFYYSNTGTSAPIAISFGTFVSPLINAWHALAIVRSGNSLYGFIDGVQSGNVATITQPIYTTAAPLQIGSLPTDGSPYTGYLDEVRITVGTARYTANYAISVPQFPN